MPRRCNGLNDQAALVYITLVLVEYYLKSGEDSGILSGPSEKPRVDRGEGGASRVIGVNLKESAGVVSEDKAL